LIQIEQEKQVEILRIDFQKVGKRTQFSGQDTIRHSPTEEKKKQINKSHNKNPMLYRHPYIYIALALLDGNPGTRVTGHPSPVTLVPGHFFYFFYIFLHKKITFLKKKMEKNCVFSLFFLSFSLYFFLSLYTQIGFFLV
jgi:hypothetical protein